MPIPANTTPGAPANRCPGCFSDTGGVVPCPRCGFDPAVPGPASALAPGSLLAGQFLIGRVLGKPGGFGITYLALDQALRARVAIKEYLPRDLALRAADGLTIAPHSTADADNFRFGLDQFLNEARTLARLDHPNIVRVRQFLEANGSAYLVMDYYQGLSLAEYLARQPDGRLPEAKALALIQPILDGLPAVHAEGFLHRDIKPANIYLARTPSGGARPILLDFGAARQSVGERSRSLSVLVTEGYAPFEQYSRKGRQGPWTDVYAAAAVLYRMLTGQNPPPAPERMDEDEVVPASAFGVSAAVSEALARGLAMAAEARPQNVTAFQRGLQGSAAGGQGQAPARPAPPRGATPRLALDPATGAPELATAPNPTAPRQTAPARPARATPPAPVYRTARAGGSGGRLLGWGIALGVLVLIFAGLAAMLPTVPPSAPPTPRLPLTATPPITPARPQAAIPSAPLGASAEFRAAWDAAHRGDAEAQFNLARRYYKGEGVSEDHRESAIWSRRAAEQGHARAQFSLGVMYHEGEGVPKDYREAAAWFRRAAEQGVAEAQHNLGNMYANGRGVPQDYREAAAWYRRAAEQGDANAQFGLALMYGQGQGVPEDYQETVAWLRRAAAQGHADAQELLRKLGE